MSALPLGAHVPGDSVLHRLSAGRKLAGLVVAGLVVAFVQGWPSSAAALLLSVGLLALARARPGVVLRSLRGLLVVSVVLAALLTRQVGWEGAAETVGDLVALVLLAGVVTTTTPVDEVLDVVERALRPARRLGVRPDRVALAFSLALRAVPATIERAEETRDAARARGLERDLRARLTPFAIRTVAEARTTGEALHARGVGDD